jgi:hypothetical protein
LYFANSFFRKTLKIVKSFSKGSQKYPQNFQNPAKTGRKRCPAVISHSTAPSSIPMV